MRINRIVTLWFMFVVLLAGGTNTTAMAQDDAVDDYILEIEEQFGVVDDPEIVARVGIIEQRLLAVIPEAKTDEREIVVRILDEDNVNAFALPDGHVYLFRGLVESCETDDMLAGVMAHELTHVFHKHHSGMGDRQIRGMLIGVAAMIATGDTEAVMLGQMLAASMVETYGRSAENDADVSGAIWTVRAGYDPVGYLELMQILEQESIHRPEPGGNYFTIHPYPDERMANIRAALEDLGMAIPENVYRVHLSLAFYLPLSETEAKRLAEWDASLESRAEGPDENPVQNEGSTQTEEKGQNENAAQSESDEIPPSLLREYRLRQELFSSAALMIPSDGSGYGVIALDGNGIFYIIEESEDALISRAENVISRLGEKLLGGLRSYEVQSRAVEGVPVLLADRRIIIYATEEDAELLGKTTEEINLERTEMLKDILYRYYVDRRI